MSLFQEYPPNRTTHKQAFLAVVGALVESSGKERATKFIQDILCRQLHVQDINEIWEIPDPMQFLTRIYKNEGSKALPESRLMWVSGKETMMACYHVGIYVDKQIVGQGA